ncbi:MAG TPA: hypothetical protein VKE95_04765 [Burkholderiales bacterium]|nr:hypothetical protein [Burkholderiales bacterium]
MKLAFFRHGIFKRNIPKRPAAAIAVTLVAAASLVIGRERPALEVVESSPARTQNTPAAPEIDLDKLTRARADEPQSDPFAPRNFAAAPRAKARAAAAAPAPKTAPPLPFTYVGWVSQDGKTEVYVTRGQELISIAAGEQIGPEYRVDSITDSAIRFTYLPMKTHQVLARAEPEAAGPASEPKAERPASEAERPASEPKAQRPASEAKGERADYFAGGRPL